MTDHDVIDADVLGIAHDLLGRLARKKMEVCLDRRIRELLTRAACNT